MTISDLLVLIDVILLQNRWVEPHNPLIHPLIYVQSPRCTSIVWLKKSIYVFCMASHSIFRSSAGLWATFFAGWPALPRVRRKRLLFLFRILSLHVFFALVFVRCPFAAFRCMSHGRQSGSVPTWLRQLPFDWLPVSTNGHHSYPCGLIFSTNYLDSIFQVIILPTF